MLAVQVIKFKASLASLMQLSMLGGVTKCVRRRCNMSGGGKRKVDRLKVAVFGLPGCGKTALTVRFLTKRFIGDYERNTENVYRQDVDIDGQRVSLEVLDTKLDIQESLEDDASFERGVKWADAFIIVYDITDPASMRAVPGIKTAIDRVRCTKCTKISAPTVLAANKADLVQSRAVTADEGKGVARLLGVPFFEVSVRESYEGVAGLFSALSAEHKASSATPSRSVFRGLRDRTRRKGRFSMLSRQRSVSM